MRHRWNAVFPNSALAILVLIAAGPRPAAAGGAEVIHSFGDGDGEYPATDLVIDGSGTLYGTTTQGGGPVSRIIFHKVGVNSQKVDFD